MTSQTSPLTGPVPDACGVELTAIPGGVLAAAGFSAAGVHAGFRRDPERKDLGMVVVCGDEPASAAGVFTRNLFCAAPVTVDRAHLAASGGRARAMIINSGNANAATGQPGLDNARATAAMVGEALGCPAEQVIVSSTGVIGVQLPMDVVARAVPIAVDALGCDPEHDTAVARAIMTTDTVMKQAAVAYVDVDGNTYHVGGMCKGSGMISPNMATMIALVTTDVAVAPDVLQAALSDCARTTFNRVTVDSDTSTNDTCVAMASGVAGQVIASVDDPRYAVFHAAMRAVTDSLARQIAKDGEGATRLVKVTVMGAASEDEAELAARTVATSPLVKTAIAGHDANWGRIAAALGRSGAHFDQYGVDIDILGIPVCRGGLALDFDEDEALRRFEAPEVDILCDLGAGEAHATIWTCDLTHGYISINGDYRS